MPWPWPITGTPDATRRPSPALPARSWRCSSSTHTQGSFDVEDGDGERVRWQAEVSSANRLTQLGWNRSTLRPGDQVTLFGRRVRSGAPYINLSERARLIRTDTCEELYRSNSPPEGAALVCEPSG
ncbi:MAG: DUF6152 family protein [Rhodospirillaceae bacterium]|nr:DUF6152 family protein [Rhodospirillaceae bacterium]